MILRQIFIFMENVYDSQLNSREMKKSNWISY